MGKRQERHARFAFVGVLVLALIGYTVCARHQWFHADDWFFIAGRDGGDIGDLFRPHNEHWSTLPILAFRALWQVAGLHSYVPYLVLIIVLHLTIAVLARIVMLRSGVRPWTATAAATAFVAFGTGHDNIVWAFQIGFAGALAFGYAHLLLADHDGPLSRRDWFGLLAGTAALMCSGVGVTMIAIVGLAALLRRGWRLALLHVVPLAVLFAAWLALEGRGSYDAGAASGDVLDFTTTYLRATFASLGQVPGVGLALGVLLVVGLIIAWAPFRGHDVWAHAAAPGALLVGGLMFLVVTGFGRAGGDASPYFTQLPEASRYLHVVAALMLPALAVAVDAVARRFGVVGAIVAAGVFLIGIPGNVAALDQYLDDNGPAWRAYRELIIATPRLEIARHLPRSYEPFPFFNEGVTIGWLLDSEAAGRLPPSTDLTPAERSRLSMMLVLREVKDPPAAARCTPVPRPVTHEAVAGDAIVVEAGAAVDIAYAADAAPLPPRRYRAPSSRLTLASVVGPVPLRIDPLDGGRVRLCLTLRDRRR